MKYRIHTNEKIVMYKKTDINGSRTSSMDEELETSLIDHKMDYS
jgi:hypothetical protein